MNPGKMMLAAMAVALSATFFGCPKRQAVKPDVEAQTTATVSEPSKPPKERQPELKVEWATIYFDFDSHAIRDDQKAALQDAAKMLREQAQIRLKLEGHCDERGTVEYNLALGDRRAQAVKNYLQGLGIQASRLETVSYGEERPAVPGSDEASWAKNRRVEMRPIP